MRIRFKDLGSDWPLEKPINIKINDESSYQFGFVIEGPTYQIPFYGRGCTKKEAVENLKKDILLFISAANDSLGLKFLEAAGFKLRTKT